MKQKPVEIDRASYKQVKNMNREQLSDFLTRIYADGMKDGAKEAVNLDVLREIIGSVNGIGEKRLDEIMNAITNYYNAEKEE